MNFFRTFRKKQNVQNNLSEDFQQIQNYENSTEYKLEDLSRNRTVGEILNSTLQDKRQLAIKLLHNKKLIGKRRLENFEILSEVVKNTKKKDQIEIELFFFKNKEVNRNQTIAQKNKYSLTVKKETIIIEKNPIYECQAKVRREDENIYLHQKLKLYKDKIVITKGQKNSKIAQILFSQINKIQIDEYQPSTIILETNILNYYLLFIKPDKTKKFDAILQENYQKHKQIQIAQKIKKLTDECTFNQTNSFLEIANYTIREIIQVKALKKIYFNCLKNSKLIEQKEQTKIEKVEQFIDNFQVYETHNMNILIKEMIELDIFKAKDIKFSNRKTSLKNQMINLYNSQTGEIILNEETSEDFEIQNINEKSELPVDCYKNAREMCICYLSQFPRSQFFQYFFQQLNKEQLNELDKQVNQQIYGVSKCERMSELWQ